MTEHPVFVGRIDLFVTLSYALTLAGTVWLFALFRNKRYLFVKPSIVLLVWTHILFQWPSAIFAAYYEMVLPDPYTFLLLIHGFVFLGLLLSEVTGRQQAEDVFARITSNSPVNISKPLIVLAIYCSAVVAIYLWAVPFSQTGLYVIVVKPELAALARSQSLKGLASPVLTYLYSTMASGAAPLLAVLIAMQLLAKFRSRSVIGVFSLLILFAALLLAASLPGARGTAVKLLLVVVIAFLLRKGLPFRPVRFVLITAGILAPAAILTLLRESQSITASNFVQYLGNYIFSRAFIMPLQTGAFYVHHAQTHGFIGIAGIPRLAELIGVTPIDVPDTIGSIYAPRATLSVRASANGGFLLSYYSYFGVIALPLSLALLGLLDLALAVYRNLTQTMLVPAVAAISVGTLAFISSDYTTVLITHGFVAILVFASALDLQLRRTSRAHQPDVVVPFAG